jgi:hypothetical protein
MSKTNPFVGAPSIATPSATLSEWLKRLSVIAFNLSRVGYGEALRRRI